MTKPKKTSASDKPDTAKPTKKAPVKADPLTKEDFDKIKKSLDTHSAELDKLTETIVDMSEATRNTVRERAKGLEKHMADMSLDIKTDVKHTLSRHVTETADVFAKDINAKAVARSGEITEGIQSATETINNVARTRAETLIKESRQHNFDLAQTTRKYIAADNDRVLKELREKHTEICEAFVDQHQKMAQHEVDMDGQFAQLREERAEDFKIVNNRLSNNLHDIREELTNLRDYTEYSAKVLIGTVAVTNIIVLVVLALMI